MNTLFSPSRIRSLALSNRIMVSPMCQYVAVDGAATAWHVVHLGGLASSGAGALFIESTAVEPAGRITPGDLGLWDDATEAALKTAIDAVRAVSTVPVVLQLGHAGRKASSAVPWEGGQLIAEKDGGWVTFAPSAVPQIDGETLPQALDHEGLKRIREAFVASTLRAVRLGVDAIELHGGHGYLLHQFLSPISNHRDDDYGGSLENRLRFPLEVFNAVRAALPEGMPLGIKISASDWVDGGWDIDQSIEFAKALKTRGIDWITASSGGISPLQKIAVGPDYQVPFARAIKEATGVRTVAVGLITEAQQADAIIASGAADHVAVARGMLYDPRWGWHAAAQLHAQVEAAPSYWRAPPRDHADIFPHVVHGAR